MIQRLFSGRNWHILVFFSALALGVIVSMPQWVHMIDGRYQGIPVHLNSDEFGYLPRVQDSLAGRGSSLGTAVTGGEHELPLLQGALIEQFYGKVFGWIGWPAATLLNVMDFVVPVVFFLVLVGFLRACGFTRRRAFIAAILFCALELYNLGRPIHQRASFLLVLLSLWGLIEGLERSWIFGVLGGAIMGLLIGVYFWSFSAAWGWWAVLLLIALFSIQKNRKTPLSLLLFGGIGFLSGLPFLIAMRAASDAPLYDEVFFRSGVGSSHIPESWPWTILFGVMALGMGILTWKQKDQRVQYLLCTVVVAFLLLNQHVIHGTLFLFASHYLFFLGLAAVMTLVWVWGRWNLIGLCTVLAAAVFLSGIAYDNRSIISQWDLDEKDFSEQHLADSIPVFRSLDRSVILSDPLTSSFIASYTDHDVTFTHYVQHELRSHQDLAERYCLTQIFTPNNLRTPEAEHVLIFGAAYDAVYDDAGKNSLREKELQLVQSTCDEVDLDWRNYIKKLNVQYVLWNEKRNPDWNIRRLENEITLVEQGEGWSLWIFD